MTVPTADETTGRAAQRRRTRRAIVNATMDLLARGVDPSVNDIAEAAEVSRRTVYLHFPTLDQLLLDATVGVINVDVDAALAGVTTDDPHERLRTLVRELFRTMRESLPLGRRLIKLTVDAPEPSAGGARRGHRRIGWLEWVVEPLRADLPAKQVDQLVSSLCLVIGWEAFIALADVRGLSPRAAESLTLATAATLIDATRGAA